MSCYLIQYKDKSKVMVPVTSREEYLQLRSQQAHVNRVAAVRSGNTKQKNKLLQFNYSCIPTPTEGDSSNGVAIHGASSSKAAFHETAEGNETLKLSEATETSETRQGRLKGCQTASTSVGMDIDHIAPEDMQPLAELIVECKDELGLLMLERSVRGEGFHIVFRRHPEMTQEENLHWASDLIGVPFDAAAKDITRVFFATTADPKDLLYLNDELFAPHPSPLPSIPLRGKGVDTTSVDEAKDAANDMKPLETSEATETLKPQNSSAYPAYYESGVSSHSPIRGGAGEGLGVSYSDIVASLVDLLGGAPAHGSRNNFIFTMAAYLRYICNDDPNWIAEILPTYGEARDKWRRTIDSACQRSQYKAMPQIVKRAIDNAKAKANANANANAEEALPPAMPTRLPPLIRHLVKNVPEVCRPAVANAVFPALAAHLNGVKFWLIDGTEKEATFMCVTMAKQSSGKSAVNKPIEYIVADIVERDEINRRREQEWKDATAQKGANKEKPKRPDDLCVQVLVSDMTNAAFVQRMKDAGGKYLYTNLEELDLLKQLQTNGTKDVGKIICLCFDNGKYGQERVGTQSVTARVDIRWNWNAASTIQKGINFFRGRLVDGTLSRVNFCTIVPDKTKEFKYGKYDEKYGETLKPFITNLNLANGHIECPQALALARKMSEKCAEEAALTDDDIYEDLAHRAVTIAYMKAMVLYIAHDMNWSKEIAEFVQWSLDYDLWCKTHFFGEKVIEEKAKEKVKKTRGRKNLLELLPTSFTLQDAQEVRHLQGLDEEGCKGMIGQWTCRGYIEHDTNMNVYIKTEKYRSRL